MKSPSLTILGSWLLCLGALASGCGHAEGFSGTEEDPVVGPPPSVAAPPPGEERYDRKQWQHWVDTDRDCQNTRHELLIRDSLEEVSFKSARGCKVTSGLWVSASTGAQWRQSQKLDADHIVALKWAHSHGGDRWTKSLKRRFANDLDNLQLIERRQNTAKGARGPSRWLPASPSYICPYIHKFNAIVVRYQLTFTTEELARIRAAKAEHGCGQ